MSLPETETTRVYLYLAKIAGKTVDLTPPRTRLERFLAYWAGMDVTLPDAPYSRLELFLLAAMGEGSLPAGCYTRYELFLNNIAGGIAALPETDNDMVEIYLREIASIVVELVYEGNLPTTITRKIIELIRYGKCVQNNTPSLNNYAGIMCNNGELRYGAMGNNLFDPNSAMIKVGYYYYTPGGAETQSLYNYCYVGYIPVEAGSYYIFYGKRVSDNSYAKVNRIHWYDANKNYLGTNSNFQNNIGIGVAPSNAVYARLSCSLFGSTAITMEDVQGFNWTFRKGLSEVNPFEPFVGGVKVYGNPEVLTVTPNDQHNAQTASLVDLLGIGDYEDTQEVIEGSVTRAVGVKVLNGSEDWVVPAGGYSRFSVIISNMKYADSVRTLPIMATNFRALYNSEPISSVVVGDCYTDENKFYVHFTGSLDDFKAYLTAQYAAGTPVVVVYPLAESTTDSVIGQPINVFGSVSSTTNTPPAKVKITY